MTGNTKRPEKLKQSLLMEFFVILLLVTAILIASIVRTANVRKKEAEPMASQSVATDGQSESALSVYPIASDASGLPPAGGSLPAVTTGLFTTAPVSQAFTTSPVFTTALTSGIADDDKVIYLTFDDGPTENTKNLLDVLDRYGVKATFFVIHTYDGCEAQIKELYDRGQQIALHSYSHEYSIYRSVDTYFEDLQKISDLVYNATGYRSMLLRFPGGTSNTISRNYNQGIMTELSKEVVARGYQYFDWDWDSTDAEANRQDPDVIVQKSTEAIGNDNHVILLMHDAAAKTTTVEALPRVIEAYRNAGYRFDVLSPTSYTYQHNPNN